MRLAQSCTATNPLLRRTIESYLLDRFVAGIRPVFQETTSMFLTSLVRIYRRWRRYDASLRELSRLGDRELADIGVNRSEITSIAWEHARS